MGANVTSSFEPYTLRPLPPLIPWVSDLYLSLFIPIAVHWLTSAFFELCERTGWLEQYRLHTSEEELAKNRVTRLECLRALQTLLGLGLGMLGESEVTGSEDYDLSIWIRRVHSVFAVLPNVLYLTGVDFKTMTATLSMPATFLPAVRHRDLGVPDIEVLVAKSFYWTYKQMVLQKHPLDTSPATNFGAHFTIWDRLMGTYFADQEQAERLRRKGRHISRDSAMMPQCEEVALGGENGSGHP
ncbi:MAG: hypothetical protein Q9222_003528 [Ikaeria aurantiellina]